MKGHSQLALKLKKWYIKARANNQSQVANSPLLSDIYCILLDP